eukprot:1144885-Pelagomonas_calceolata.AAC.6
MKYTNQGHAAQWQLQLICYGELMQQQRKSRSYQMLDLSSERVRRYQTLLTSATKEKELSDAIGQSSTTYQITSAMAAQEHEDLLDAISQEHKRGGTGQAPAAGTPKMQDEKCTQRPPQMPEATATATAATIVTAEACYLKAGYPLLYKAPLAATLLYTLVKIEPLAAPFAV